MAITVFVCFVLAGFSAFCVWFIHTELSRNGYDPVSTVIALFHRATSGKYRYTTVVENWPDLGSVSDLFGNFLVRTDSFYGGLVSPGNHSKRFRDKRPLSWAIIWKTRRSLSYLKDENGIAMVGEQFRPLVPFREAMVSALDHAEKGAVSLLTNTQPSIQNAPREQDREKCLAEMAESNLRIAQFSAAAAAASAIGSLLQVLAK